MRNPLEGCASMSTSGEIFAQHPSVLNRYFKGSAAREAEKAVELPPVGGPPLSIFVLLLLLFSLYETTVFCAKSNFLKMFCVVCFLKPNNHPKKRGIRIENSKKHKQTPL